MLSAMQEASWVPVTVDPLVPPARLGALMVERRTKRGLDVAQMADAAGLSVGYLYRLLKECGPGTGEAGQRGA